jgi:hypothetical protein
LLYDAGARGYYLSATPYSGDGWNAYSLRFNSDYYDWGHVSDRYYGQAVRPVSE